MAANQAGRPAARPTSAGGGSAPSSAAYSVSGLPSTPSLPRSLPAPAAGLPVLPLASIAHAFNYHVAVLRDGAKQVTRTARSRKAEHGFLEDVSLPWGQQVAVMFQIMCALVLDVPV